MAVDLLVAIASATILGFAVGSFLNVVIFRLPEMMQRDWRAQCAELLGQVESTEISAEKFGLAFPPSRCPSCNVRIKPWHNIPILSYLWLKGRCANCGTHISLRYPFIEFLGGLIAFAVIWQLGMSFQSIMALLLSWSLIALTFIDFDHQLLPDQITLPLVWLGLLINLDNTFIDIESSIIGAVAGYLFLWSIYHIFRLLTGKEGMGYGDFKLFAVFGAWLGWQMLPQILLISALAGSVIGISLILFRGHERNIPIPFGPYLAIGGWIALLWGSDINRIYLNYTGLA